MKHKHPNPSLKVTSAIRAGGIYVGQHNRRCLVVK